MKRKITALFLIVATMLTLLSLVSCEQAIIDGLDHVIDVIDELEMSEDSENADSSDESRSEHWEVSSNLSGVTVNEDGEYDDRDRVALYLHLYGKLPKNYVTKNEAEALGWTGGSVEKYAEGKCIGGDKFGNYEGILPKKQGRVYYECDIDTLGKESRGAKRIVYSNDGLVYYTDDHYDTFTLLYGEK